VKIDTHVRMRGTYARVHPSTTLHFIMAHPVGGAGASPMASEDDVQFYNHCLVGDSESFAMLLYVSSPSSNDAYSRVAFPFAIKMDRLRKSNRLTYESKEIQDIGLELSKALRNQFGPLPPRSLFDQPFGGYEGISAFVDRLEIHKYRELVCKQERACKVAEAERVRAETESARIATERQSAIADLGEIRKIGKQNYLIKNNEVFQITDVSLIHGHIPIRRTVRDCYLSQMPNITLSQITAHLKTAHQIRQLRGSRVFATIEDAEAHWIAVEEAEIIAEARRRLAEEDRLTAIADREARIREAMQRLRP
jgi:hypothetical protein